MKDLLKSRKMYHEGIDATKMRVKVSLLKTAEVKEDEHAFVSSRAGWQIGFAFTNKNDALKLVAVAVANDFNVVQGPSLDINRKYYEVSINLDELYNS